MSSQHDSAPTASSSPSSSQAPQPTTSLLDALTGLYYFGARFYDYAVGRFISEDSNTGRQKDPLSLNRDVCAEDNPMKFVGSTSRLYTVEERGGNTH